MPLAMSLLFAGLVCAGAAAGILVALRGALALHDRSVSAERAAAGLATTRTVELGTPNVLAGALTAAGMVGALGAALLLAAFAFR